MDITLELIDDASGEVFASSDVPLDSLPQSFARMETTLTVGDHEYRVVGADPGNRDDIARAGLVKLRLRRVEDAPTVDPKGVLFSLPTLEDALPACAAPVPGAPDALEIHEDHFRQVELVRASLLADIEAELDDVRRVLSAHRSGAGFTACHVRRRVKSPLDGAGVKRSEVEFALRSKGRLFAIRGHGVVVGGFAVPAHDALVYGLEHGPEVKALGLVGVDGDAIGALHPVALAHGLVLVDWCAARVLRAHDEGFVA